MEGGAGNRKDLVQWTGLVLRIFLGGGSIFFTLHSSVYNSIKIYRALQTIPSHKKGETYKS